jgi:uncharacterized metal-binding protein YceD (DUF177 family)
MIPFVGLKVGVHDFDFEATDSFFDELEYSIIHSGSVNVHISLEKKETMLIAVFTINGKVKTNCDRCNDPIEVPVKGNYQLIFKFGLEPEFDENLVVLHPDEYEIDMKEHIYEFITVSLPTRLVHPKGECNEEMIALLNEYSVQQPESDDEEEWDEEDWDDDDWDEDVDDEEWDDDEGQDGEGEDNDDKDGPIDPRWTPLLNLN